MTGATLKEAADPLTRVPAKVRASSGAKPTKSHNQHGQEMGAKGRNTRRRLIDVTTRLLENGPLHAISVADIAKQAATSPATFYVYFKDVDEAALAVIDEHSQSTPELLEMIDADWQHGSSMEHARAFVSAYADVWQSQSAIFRARNLAAEAGDARFYAAREKAVRPLLDALARKVARNQTTGRLAHDMHPYATSAVLMTMLERLAAVARRQTGEAGITYDSIIIAAAQVMSAVLEAAPPGRCSPALGCADYAGDCG